MNKWPCVSFCQKGVYSSLWTKMSAWQRDGNGRDKQYWHVENPHGQTHCLLSLVPPQVLKITLRPTLSLFSNKKGIFGALPHQALTAQYWVSWESSLFDTLCSKVLFYRLDLTPRNLSNAAFSMRNCEFQKTLIFIDHSANQCGFLTNPSRQQSP